MKVKDKKVAAEQESIVVLDTGMAPGGLPCCFGAIMYYR